MATLAGKADLAISMLGQYPGTGAWFAPIRLRRSAELARLQELPEFQRLVEVCDQRRALAQAEARLERITLEPLEPRVPAGQAGPAGQAPARQAGPVPLLIAMHGNGSSAAGEVERWRPATAQGWRVAMLQSSRVGGPRQYEWSDWELAKREAGQHFAELIAERAAADVVVGGFSAGATQSIVQSVSGALPARGFIATAPWLPDVDVLRPLLQSGPAALALSNRPDIARSGVRGATL